MGIRTTINEQHFDKQQAAQYKLSILAGVDSFFYAVSSGSNELLVVKDFQLPAPQQNGGLVTAFNDFFAKEELLKLPYRQIKVGLSSMVSTLVPQRLFKDTDLEQYLAPVAEVEDYQGVYRDELPTLDLTNVYAADASWKSVLESHFKYCKIYHQNTVLLRSFQRRQRGKSGYALYAHVNAQTVQLYLYDNSNLVFSNIFNYQSAKDFVY
ncbi:MAG: DUF3822 family protein, partial [Saprospiraceae bacterium]